jgi:hypothetical protein
LEDLGLDGDNTEMDGKQMVWEDVAWTDAGQDRDWWWAFVNTVMNLQALQTSENFLSN